MKAASVRWLYSFDQKLVNPPGNPMGRWLLWASVALGVSFSMVNIYAALGGRRGMWTIFGHDYLRLGTEGYLTTELEWIAAVLKLGIALLPTTLLPCAGLPLHVAHGWYWHHRSDTGCLRCEPDGAGYAGLGWRSTAALGP